MSKLYRKQNLSFYGDIVRSVIVSPDPRKYKTHWPRGASVGDAMIDVGPVITPRTEESDTDEPQLLEMNATLGAWREFTELPPKIESFINFANKYGLLGLRLKSLVYDGNNLIPREPVALWFQNYVRLRLLRGLLIDGPKQDNFPTATLAQNKADSEAVREEFGRLILRLDQPLPKYNTGEKIHSVQIGSMVEPIGWNFTCEPTKRLLKQHAYDCLSDHIGYNSRLAVSFRGRRRNFRLGDRDDLTSDLGGDILVTSLQPESLLGLMYLGIFLELSEYNIRPSTKACEHCGRPLIEARSNAKYCGNPCRQKAKRAREREKENAQA